MAAKVLILIALCMQGVVAIESVFLNLNATISVKSSSAPGKLVFTITTSDEMFHPSDIILKTDSKYFETYPMDPRKIVVSSCLPAGFTEVLEFSLSDGYHDHNDNNILTINILPVTPIYSIPLHIVVPVDLIPYEIPGIIEVHQITFSNAGACASFRCNVTSTNDEKHFWIEADTNSIRTFVRDLVYNFPYQLEITCSDASGVDFTPASVSEINIEAIFTDMFQPGTNDSLAASNAEGDLHFQTQLENAGGDRYMYIDQYERSEEERRVDLALFDTFDFNGEILERQKRDVTTSAPASNVAYNVVSTKRRCLCSNNFPRPGPNGFFIRKYRPVKVTQVTVLTAGTTSMSSTFTSNVTPAIDLTQSSRDATADSTGLSNLPTTNVVSTPTGVPSTEEETPTSGGDSQLSITDNPMTTAMTHLNTSGGSKTTYTTQLTTSSDSLTTVVTQTTTSDRRETTHARTSESTLLTSTEPTATETAYVTTANALSESESTQQPTLDVPTTTDRAESISTAESLTTLTTTASSLTVKTVAELSTSTVVSSASTTELTSTDEPASLSTTKLTTTVSPSAIETTQSAREVYISSVTTTQQSTAIVEEATISSSIQTTNGGSMASTQTTVSPATRRSSSILDTESTPTQDQQQTGPTMSHTHQTPTNQPGTTNILHAETPGPGFFGDWTNLWAIIGGSGGIALVGIIGTVIYKVLMVQPCRSLSSVGTSSITDAGNVQYNTEPVYSGDATSSTVALVPNEEGLTPVGS